MLWPRSRRRDLWFMQHSPMLNPLQTALKASANPYKFPERVNRYHQTHLQGNPCSLWKQSHSKNLQGTPNTAPCSRMGCNSLQGKAGLCCSLLGSNVQVDTVLHWLLSLRNNTTVTESHSTQFTNTEGGLTRRMVRFLWWRALDTQQRRLHSSLSHLVGCTHPFPS